MPIQSPCLHDTAHAAEDWIRTHETPKQARDSKNFSQLTYVRVSGQASRGAGAWFGVHFGLWKTHGTTPLWLIFSDSDFGRGQEVRQLIEPWAKRRGALTVVSGQSFAIALEIPEGEEKGGVVRRLVDDIKSVAAILEALSPLTTSAAGQEVVDENFASIEGIRG